MTTRERSKKKDCSQFEEDLKFSQVADLKVELYSSCHQHKVSFTFHKMRFSLMSHLKHGKWVLTEKTNKEGWVFLIIWAYFCSILKALKKQLVK